ncbi:MAG: sugar transferase [Myxococcota bacterium]|nr:sugar transferase [Myxococcota bacterium]
MTKRALDVALAGTVLLVGAPLLGVLSAAIRLESAGPALFRQTRVGRGKLPIRTVKLRTMVVDADRQGPQITASGDSRITRVGRVLRRTKLDELPQLWNVLVGDMSVVGPRPEVPRYTETYRPEWQNLFTVRPGITDLASLTFRDEESLLAAARDRERAYREVIMPAKLALALESVERSSLRHDLSIIARTALSVLGYRSTREEAILADVRRRIAALDQLDQVESS